MDIESGLFNILEMPDSMSVEALIVLVARSDVQLLKILHPFVTFPGYSQTHQL